LSVQQSLGLHKAASRLAAGGRLFFRVPVSLRRAVTERVADTRVEKQPRAGAGLKAAGSCSPETENRNAAVANGLFGARHIGRCSRVNAELSAWK
jgi:hypothetical protein